MLGDLIAKNKEDKDLRLYLKRKLVETVVKEPLKSTDHLRASGIVRCCPREEAIRSRDNIKYEEKIPTQRRWTFAFGRSLERMLRDEQLGDIGGVVGKWKCVACDHTPEAVNGYVRYPKPITCLFCGKNSRFEYVEEQIYDPIHNVGGHPDGFINHRGEYGILELKTANEDNFRMFKVKPSEDHVGQVQTYMYMSGFKKAIVWYFNKNSSEDVAHWIQYDKEIAMHLLNKGSQLKEFFTSGVLPPRICPNNTCPRAEKCKVSHLCFGSTQ